MRKHQSFQSVTAGELANYVVCPEAWRLKLPQTQSNPSTKAPNVRTEESRQIRKEWVERQDLSAKLRSYARVAYLLLFALAIIVFLLETKRTNLLGLLRAERSTVESAEAPQRSSNAVVPELRGKIPTEITLLLLTLGLIIFLWDLFERRSAKIRASSGLGDSSQAVSLKGSSHLPGREFHSENLGLSSKPDALVRENNILIPVDIHPLTNKVRDRHVIVMLAHLRLLEEIESERPPHGVLLMGKDQRRVLIKNTAEKQRWLSSLIDEMQSILEGVPAVPAPAPFKCKQCDVRDVCQYSMAGAERTVNHSRTSEDEN